MNRQNILIPFILLFVGCTTFGGFTNLKQNETTPEEVKAMMGEPAEVVFQDDREIWKYHLQKEAGKKENLDGMKTVMGLDFIFKDAVLENYDITVSRIQVPKKNPKASDEKNSHMNKGQKSGDEFMRVFDKNRDGRVTREEFPGPDRGFQKIDRDHNGYIDGQEAPDKVPAKHRIKK